MSRGGSRGWTVPAIAWGLVLLLSPHARGVTVVASEQREYDGTCDASAAVALSPTVFVLANDEDQTLRLYRSGESRPLRELDWTAHLDLEADRPEADIEAATRVDDTVYWITSHGRSSKGKERPNRRRFFATRITRTEGDEVSLKPLGKTYPGLLDDLLGTDSLDAFKLKDAAEKAPEDRGGFNIEALAARPEGGLWIGFRNPIPGDKALLVLLENPAEVAGGKTARIGPSARLDLGGRGLRSMEYVPALDAYLCVAGPDGDTGTFALYTWSGEKDAAPRLVAGLDLGDLHPEAMIDFGAGSSGVTVELLSDDGGRDVGGAECKTLPQDRRHFRAVKVVLKK